MDGALRTAKRLQQLLCKILSLVDFAQQLLLQMTPRSLFDRATLSDYALLLRVTFAPCSRFPHTATRAGSWAGARRCFALLVSRTDPLMFSAARWR
jgi:hypothetical protein